MFGFASVSELIMFTIVIIISLVFHELSHGFVSYLQGDRTAKDAGRLTLNPISHIDPIGLVAIYLIHFGWAKPVPINPKYYKNRRIGVILTSIAGPLANMVVAFLAAFIFAAINQQTYLISYFFINLIAINITLALFNMIPIPPLDGSKIFASLLGGKIAEWIYGIQRIGMILIFLIFWLPPVSNALSNIINSLTFGVLNNAFLIMLHHPYM